MSLSKSQAGDDLAAIEDVVARVRRSRVYRVAGDIAMFWGGLQLVRYAAIELTPLGRYPWGWLAVDALGVAVTLAMLRRALAGRPRLGARTLARALAAFVLFYGFGFLWSGLVGHFDGREATVFWHTLFLFGYCLAGLWLGLGFLVIGLSLTAMILAVYAFAGAYFSLGIALITGCGYILCGLWMHRA